MEKRLANILKLVIEEVIETGEPVGSQHLVQAHGLEVSPATIRNWFSELENDGWIEQTHTSSGRMPTEKGFRCYVDELMDEKPLAKRHKEELQKALSLVDDQNIKIKILAKGITALVGSAVIVGLNEADTYYTGLSLLFSQPEFKDWNNTVSLTQVLDRLDEIMNTVRTRKFKTPTAMIGSQCPFGSICGSILYTLSDNTLFGILGPMRLDYKKGFSALNAIKEIK